MSRSIHILIFLVVMVAISYALLWWGLPRAHAAIRLPKAPTVQCKKITKPAGDHCNTCSYRLCTDGKKQWADPPWSACTARYCPPPAQKYDPKEWSTQ